MIPPVDALIATLRPTVSRDDWEESVLLQSAPQKNLLAYNSGTKD